MTHLERAQAILRDFPEVDAIPRKGLEYRIAGELQRAVAADRASWMPEQAEPLPAVGSSWVDIDKRRTWTALLLVPGAARPILLQQDGAGRDCSSRLSLEVDDFEACFRPLGAP